nr:hypothetical protein GCM10020063_111410 [Dactylosporangium thailandense]
MFDSSPYVLIVIDAVAGSPWVLLAVFVIAGLDSLVPLSPSETTLITVSVLSGATGRPWIVFVIVAAAGGAFAGDTVAYRIGTRLRRRARERDVYAWVRRTLDVHGGHVFVFARWLPGGRAASALAAGVVGYPAGRFQAWTAAGASLWASTAGLIGFGCGIYFDGVIWKALLFAYAAAAVLLVAAEALRRLSAAADQEVDAGADGRDGQRQGGLLEHDHGAGRADLADHSELESGGA